MDFHGWFETPEALFIAMEYVELGDLSKYIGEAITEIDAVEVANDLLFGLKVMHSEGFTHRDLKPQVILHPTVPYFGTDSEQSYLHRTSSFGKNDRSRHTGVLLLPTSVFPNGLRMKRPLCAPRSELLTTKLPKYVATQSLVDRTRLNHTAAPSISGL